MRIWRFLKEHWVELLLIAGCVFLFFEIITQMPAG